MKRNSRIPVFYTFLFCGWELVKLDKLNLYASMLLFNFSQVLPLSMLLSCKKKPTKRNAIFSVNSLFSNLLNNATHHHAWSWSSFWPIVKLFSNIQLFRVFWLHVSIAFLKYHIVIYECMQNRHIIQTPKIVFNFTTNANLVKCCFFPFQMFTFHISLVT